MRSCVSLLHPSHSSSVTLVGDDSCPGVPSLRRNLTRTDSKPIQCYLRPQGNLPLITIVTDAEIAVQLNQSCLDSHSFLRLRCELPILAVLVWGIIAIFPHYFTYQKMLWFWAGVLLCVSVPKTEHSPVKRQQPSLMLPRSIDLSGLFLTQKFNLSSGPLWTHANQPV